MHRISIALAAALLFIGAAQAESLKDSTPNITVAGVASEEVAPDRATITLGVVTERPTAAEAGAENARAAQAIVDEMKAQGVEEKNIRTLGVTLEPYTTEEAEPQPQPRGRPAARRVARGFRARNEMRVTVTGVDKAAALLGRLVDKGANSVEGVTFSVSDDEARMDRLRQQAVKDAERRAKAYVEALGMRLSRVLEIQPEQAAPVEPMARVASAQRGGGAEAAPVPLEGGLQKLSAHVTVTWAISR